MKYLANPSTPLVRAAMSRDDLGCMVTPGQGNRMEPGWEFAIDNGCFADFIKPGSWKRGKWLDLLAEHRYRPGCLFAVVPDVVCDAKATTERFDEWAPIVAAFGFPLAYVTQNGCTSDMVPWDRIACLFNGGDDAWKDGPQSYALTLEAQERGVWTHMGRVNGNGRDDHGRITNAARHGYDSCDGTYVTFGPDVNLPKLLAMLRTAHRLAEHPKLEMSA